MTQVDAGLPYGLMSMVRRRSTVRFRNGAPVQRENANLSNRLREPFREPIGPGCSQDRGRAGITVFQSAELCGSGGPVLDLLDRAEDQRRGALDGPARQVPGAVALMDLGESPFGRYEVAVRAGGHGAAGQHAGQRVRRGLELQAQDVGESAFAGVDEGAGVVRDQPAQRGAGVLGVAQVACAVECVQAGAGQAGRVADVVRPRGGFGEIGVSAQNRCQASCLRGDALDVRPAAGEGVPGGVPGRAVQPREPACSCGQGQAAGARRSPTRHAL